MKKSEQLVHQIHLLDAIRSSDVDTMIKERALLEIRDLTPQGPPLQSTHRAVLSVIDQEIRKLSKHAEQKQEAAVQAGPTPKRQRPKRSPGRKKEV